MPERRIEIKSSKTADITCGYRAVSSMESRTLYRSGDWVARLLLPRKLQILFRIATARRLLIRFLGPPGMYEWVIARTRYVDEVFSRASSERFVQVLILGAGFDSRAIRFRSELLGTNVFELDAPTTQAAKIEQFRTRSITIPDNVRFVPINFEKETLEQRLREAGFSDGAKTLALMEGVMQYLVPQAAHRTLAVLEKMTGRGSWLLFDYAHASALGEKGLARDERSVMRRLARFGESWQFGLDEGEVAPLLAGFGFKLLDIKNPRDLEDRYFKDEHDKIVGHVSDTQSIVLAEKC